MARRRFPWHDDIERWGQTRTILTWMERGDLRPLAEMT